MTWRERGACWDTDSRLFFVDAAGRPGQDIAANAKAICATCPVTVECLDYAQTRKLREGIWGGLTSREREVLRREKVA